MTSGLKRSEPRHQTSDLRSSHLSAGSWETSDLETEACRRGAEEDCYGDNRDDPDWNERDFRDYFGGEGSGRRID